MSLIQSNGSSFGSNSLYLENLYAENLHANQEGLGSEETKETFSQYLNVEHHDLMKCTGVVTPEEPKEMFVVGPMEISSQPSNSRKIISFLNGNFLSRLDHAIAMLVLPARIATVERKESCKGKKRVFATNNCKKVQEFDLHLDGGSTVNGMLFFRNATEKKDFIAGKTHDNPWIIYFNGNNQLYEECLPYFKKMGKDQDANILVFNYRGVVDSQEVDGAVPQPMDWVADGEASIRYLLANGVRENRILVWGYSLGGAIGTVTASLHREIALLNDRSFGLLSKIAGAFAKSLVEENFDRIDEYFKGWLPMGSPELAADLVEAIFQGIDWELDVVAAYEKITAPKLILFHKQDRIMSYVSSALYKGIKEAVKKDNPEAIDCSIHKGRWKKRLKREFKPARVKLKKNFGNVTDAAHTYSLQNDGAYSRIERFVGTALKRSTEVKIEI